MQQQILQDNRLDPNMGAADNGFALDAFDMSESLAIVDDLLDYFGEEDLSDGLEGAGE